jgi:hypothetical protein
MIRINQNITWPKAIDATPLPNPNTSTGDLLEILLPSPIYTNTMPLAKNTKQSQLQFCAYKNQNAPPGHTGFFPST